MKKGFILVGILVALVGAGIIASASSSIAETKHKQSVNAGADAAKVTPHEICTLRNIFSIFKSDCGPAPVDPYQRAIRQAKTTQTAGYVTTAAGALIMVIGLFLPAAKASPVSVASNRNLSTTSGYSRRVSEPTSEEAKCPKCAEFIKIEAVLCKHCHSDVGEYFAQLRTKPTTTSTRTWQEPGDNFDMWEES